MDMGHEYHIPTPLRREREAQELWAEHGWSLNGWQTGAVIAAITAVSLLLDMAGI